MKEPVISTEAHDKGVCEAEKSASIKQMSRLRST